MISQKSCFVFCPYEVYSNISILRAKGSYEKDVWCHVYCYLEWHKTHVWTHLWHLPDGRGTNLAFGLCFKQMCIWLTSLFRYLLQISANISDSVFNENVYESSHQNAFQEDNLLEGGQQGRKRGFENRRYSSKSRFFFHPHSYQIGTVMHTATGGISDLYVHHTVYFNIFCWTL